MRIHNKYRTLIIKKFIYKKQKRCDHVQKKKKKKKKEG